MTGESKGDTEPWVKEHGAKYAYTYLDKNELSGFMKTLGMGGYPSAALVNPKGKVVWVGHPASVNEKLVNEHISGATTTPVGKSAIAKRWPEEADDVKKAFLKGQYARALKYAQKLAENGNETVAADVQRVITGRLNFVKARKESGDFRGFLDAADEADKELKGLPEGDELDDLVKEVRKDREAMAVVKAQMKLDRIAEDVNEVRKEKEIPILRRRLEKIAEAHPDTIAATRANSLIQQLEGLTIAR